MNPDGFEFVDSVPEVGNPAPGATVECSVCGTAIPYAGRGRKPLYCDEHKPPSHAAKASRPGGSSLVVNRAVGELRMLYGMAGVGLRYVSPSAGNIVYDNRDKLAESYRMLLETNKRFRELFAELEGKAAWLPILVIHGDVIAAIMLARAMERQAREAEPETPTEQPGLFVVPDMPMPGTVSSV